jgi:hypothetical protein
MGRREHQAGAPSTQHRDDHPEQARAQLAEVLGEAHPVPGVGSSSAMRGGLALGARGDTRLGCGALAGSVDAGAGGGGGGSRPRGASEDGFAATTPSGGGNTEG